MRHVATGALLCLLLTGCPKSPRPEPVESGGVLAGLQLDVAVPVGSGLLETWDLPAREWSAQTGSTCRLVSLDEAAAAPLRVFAWTEAAEVLERLPAAAIPAAYSGEEELDAADLFPGLRSFYAVPTGQPALVPLSAPVLILACRRDLLQAAGRQPPGTWEEYDELVRTAGEWAPGKTVAEPWHPEWRATMFLARAAPYARHWGHSSFYFDSETGEPLIANAGFERGAEQARTTLSRLPAECRNWTPSDCRRELLEGRAAMAIFVEHPDGHPPWALPGGAEPSDAKRPVRGEGVEASFHRLPGTTASFNLTLRQWEPVPTGVHFVGLTGFGGAAAAVGGDNSDVQTAAWSFLASVLRRDDATTFPPALRSPVRESDERQPSRWAGSGWTPGEADGAARAVAATLRDRQLALELSVVGRARFRAALSEELAGWTAGETDTPTMLRRVEGRWQALIQELGRERVLRSYRRSLGLAEPLEVPEGEEP